MPDPTPLIFVNYRGTDQNWAVEFVHARMREAFGVDAVFKAGNSIPVGAKYPQILERQAVRCPVMLACIGPGWLTARRGEVRDLDTQDDWVRREIALSLQAGNHVIPLLIGNHDQVAIPRPDQLPKDIRTLTFHQAWRLAPGGMLDLTVPKLIDRLAELVPELARRRTAAGPQPGAPETPTWRELLEGEEGDW
jgi:TIR domain